LETWLYKIMTHHLRISFSVGRLNRRISKRWDILLVSFRISNR
jgi:hypothetical protein